MTEAAANVIQVGMGFVPSCHSYDVGFKVMNDTKGSMEYSVVTESHWGQACDKIVHAEKPREAIVWVCGSEAWIAQDPKMLGDARQLLSIHFYNTLYVSSIQGKFLSCKIIVK